MKQQQFIQPHDWKIIENDFDPSTVQAAESIFSLGNGAMGQRANFEEYYSGPSFQGSYIGGVYYPDKTKVGWWKNGYPEYFAKVLNAPNWIGIDVEVDGEKLDLFTCKVMDFRRELDMKTGLYKRMFEVQMTNGKRIRCESHRFLSMAENELGVINYQITLLSKSATVKVISYIDGNIKNNDSNWEDPFWHHEDIKAEAESLFLQSKTNKTHFQVCTYAHNQFFVNGKIIGDLAKSSYTSNHLGHSHAQEMHSGDTMRVLKFGGYVVSTNHPSDQLVARSQTLISDSLKKGYDALFGDHCKVWEDIWTMSDIEIIGDQKAQQAIRFNIFHLNQTYTGTDARLNIGPKGFTGEKYGGSTYWDTEAYCLPFFMATKDKFVARNLLRYRFNHLEKAIENAEKLGLNNGAALFPMVTMNGEECHNEWEITFQEIHRNAAIAYAIFNYERYTGDVSYMREMGLEVLIAIARFWEQRSSFSKPKDKFVILGVTGPNEYENNINNNWYTNYAAKWCLEYAAQKVDKIKKNYPDDYKRIRLRTGLKGDEDEQWKHIANDMYLPFDASLNIYLQQDNFLDKEMLPASVIDPAERPINQHWSWDKILRSPYIKQADVLQGFYFFASDFTKEELARHFDFYEPLTVHESSLSPSIHAILATRLGRTDKAYEMYLRTSRLDLDDFNCEVEEGLHITSMAGTWMSIVEGFGGMRVVDNHLHLNPQIHKQWKGYSFNINFRNQIIQVRVTKKGATCKLYGTEPLEVFLYGKPMTLEPEKSLILNESL